MREPRDILLNAKKVLFDHVGHFFEPFGEHAFDVIDRAGRLVQSTALSHLVLFEPLVAALEVSFALGDVGRVLGLMIYADFFPV